MELYTDEITRPYAIDLFHYLLVKDGGQFKSGSFIRVMPIFMFEMILKSSGAAVNALKGQADDRLVQKTFGPIIKINGLSELDNLVNTLKEKTGRTESKNAEPPLPDVDYGIRMMEEAIAKVERTIGGRRRVVKKRSKLRTAKTRLRRNRIKTRVRKN
jgi:hypothetical protein